MDKMQRCYDEILSEVEIRAGVGGDFSEEAYFKLIEEILSDNGDFPALDYSHFKSGGPSGQKSMRVDGYLAQPDDGAFTIVITDFVQDDAYPTFNTQELTSKFRLGERFIDECASPNFVNGLEESSEGFDVAYDLSRNYRAINRIRILFVTNALFSGRIKELKAKNIDGKRISFQLVDLRRYSDIVDSQSGHEPIEIELSEYGCSSLPALKTSTGDKDYESYLIALPGSVLANIFEEYGARLLEQNVRTFLQARGKVNQGIIRTLKETPEMFFAYNNGLTATASGLKIDRNRDGEIHISRIENLQIVNGGQTMASMYYAREKEKADLEKAFVQMKLSVLSPDKIAEFVPKISEYANTQNKVNAADFFANHPFHLNVEDLSHRIAAPKKEEAITPTRWFYERARGAYKNATAYKSDRQKKEFEGRYPKNQLIQKTDLAKYMMCFEGQPNVVSSGAQASFLKYAALIGPPEEYEKKKSSFNELWYRDMISKAVIFKGVDRLVAKSPWYVGGGSKAPIVAYSISWLVNHVKDEFDGELDFGQVWEKQDLPDDFGRIFSVVTENISNYLNDTAPENLKSITQWSKRIGCWTQIKNKPISISQELLSNCVISKKEKKGEKKSAIKEQKAYNEATDYVALVKISVAVWRDVDLFVKEKRCRISPKENAALQKRIAGRGVPSQAEAPRLFDLLSKVKKDGFEVPV
jgi:hypothetical protein